MNAIILDYQDRPGTNIGKAALKKESGVLCVQAALADEHSSVRTVSLAGNMIGNKGAGALANAMYVNRSLVEICLDSNFIASPGRNALKDAMAGTDSPRLEFVSLAGNTVSGLLFREFNPKNPCNNRVAWKA
jgi:Ran GTPase-activating protein (RanGAP) involved in mRNA processing and transport